MQPQPNIRSADAKKHCETPKSGHTAQINENFGYVIALISGIPRTNPTTIIGNEPEVLNDEVSRDAR